MENITDEQRYQMFTKQESHSTETKVCNPTARLLRDVHRNSRQRNC